MSDNESKERPMPDTPLHKLVEPFMDEPWFKAMPVWYEHAVVGGRVYDYEWVFLHPTPAYDECPEGRAGEGIARDIIFTHAVRALPIGVSHGWTTPTPGVKEYFVSFIGRTPKDSFFTFDPDPLAAVLAAHRALKERAQ